MGRLENVFLGVGTARGLGKEGSEGRGINMRPRIHPSHPTGDVIFGTSMGMTTKISIRAGVGGPRQLQGMKIPIMGFYEAGNR